MGKIYFNFKSEKFNYLETESVSDFDILLSDIAGKLVLVSMNNIKKFDCVDYNQSNKSTIKQLLKSGYKPINKLMEIIITQNYSICPLCGEDVDIEKETDVVLFDVGTKLSNLINNNVSVAKELSCDSCGHVGLYYYNIYASDEENEEFVQNATDNNSSIFVRYRYLLDKRNKYSYIPIVFDLSQLLQFFNREEDVDKDEELTQSDFIKELSKNDDKNIISMLFNTELQELFETEENPLVNEMRIELKPVELGAYSRYTSLSDFELIKEYQNIGDNQEMLLNLILK